MSIKKKISILIILITILFAAVISLIALAPVNIDYASADNAEKVLSVSQKSSITYCGKNFLDGNRKFRNFDTADSFKNECYESLSFTLDGAPVDIPYSAITFNVAEIISPKKYSLTINVLFDELEYNIPLTLVLNKAPLTVYVLLNGESNLAVNEGDVVAYSVNYRGFVNGESEVNLAVPPFINAVPKLHTTDYKVIAEGGVSDNYAFTYQYATLTIREAYIDAITDLSGDIVVEGSISPLYELIAVNAGTNTASSMFADAYSKMSLSFANTKFLDDYNARQCYKIYFEIDGIAVANNAKYTVKIKLSDSLKGGGDNYYKVAAVDNNGKTQIIDAKEVEGYLVFDTTQTGYFVIMTPVKGLSVKAIIAICLGVAVVFVLTVFLVMVFRRKY